MALVDFAILTGLTEEFETLQEIFPEFREVSSENSADVWYRTRVDSEDGVRSYEVVAAFQDQMGPLSAHSLTAKMIERWDPAHIIVVGIAGSFHKDVRLGDVIVSQQIFHYDPAKATPEGLRYRPEGYPCSVVLVKQSEALRLDKKMFDAWQQAAQNSAVGKARKLRGKDKAQIRKDLREHRPNVYFGTVASGSQVIADKEKREELLDLHGKIIGTEMEGAGVLHAAHYSRELPVPAIVIKGISDAADENKALLDDVEYWRELAKENSVRLVFELIRRGKIRPLQTDEFDLNAALGSPAEAREMVRDVPSRPGLSYQAFPHLVLPRGPLTELRIRVDAQGQEGPIAFVRGTVRYHDRSRKQRVDELQPGTHLLGEPILASPVGVYTVMEGKPARIVFTVSGYDNRKKQTEWKP